MFDEMGAKNVVDAMSAMSAMGAMGAMDAVDSDDLVAFAEDESEGSVVEAGLDVVSQIVGYVGAYTVVVAGSFVEDAVVAADSCAVAGAVVIASVVEIVAVVLGSLARLVVVFDLAFVLVFVVMAFLVAVAVVAVVHRMHYSHCSHYSHFVVHSFARTNTVVCWGKSMVVDISAFLFVSSSFLGGVL